MDWFDDGVEFVVFRVQNSAKVRKPADRHQEARDIPLDLDERVVIAKGKHRAPAQPKHRRGEFRAEPVSHRLQLDRFLRRQKQLHHFLAVVT